MKETILKEYGMKYKSTTYEDIIYNWSRNTLGITATNDMLLPDNDSRQSFLYRRLLKSCINLDSAETPSITFTLMLILLHYGLVTTEQFQMLFPDASKSFLTSLTQVRSSNGLQPRNYIESALYGQRRKVYYLNADTYRRIYLQLPAEYTDTFRIPEKTDVRINRNTSHAVATLNAPYRILSDGAFMDFNWHPRLPLIVTREIRDIIESFDLSLIPSITDRFAFPDGIMQFIDERRYAIIEQDNGTETLPTLAKKHQFYGDYFSAHQDSAIVSTVLFTIYVDTGERIRQKVKKKNDAAMRIFTTALKTITTDMQANGFLNLEQEEGYLQKRPDVSSKTVSNALLLLDKYRKDNPERTLSSSLMDDLRDYVQCHDEKRVKIRAELANTTDEVRVSSIKRDFTNLTVSSGSGTLSDMIYTDCISYVVTTKLDFDLYARYLLPRESGYIDDLLNKIILPRFGLMLHIGNATYTYHEAGRIRDKENYYALRNVLTSGRDHPAFAVENISHDVAGYLRITDMLRKLTESPNMIVLILLVSSEEEARKISRDLQLPSRFCDGNNVTRPNQRKVWISFINYKTDEYRPFAITRDGSIQYIF